MGFQRQFQRSYPWAIEYGSCYSILIFGLRTIIGNGSLVIRKRESQNPLPGNIRRPITIFGATINHSLIGIKLLFTCLKVKRCDTGNLKSFYGV